MNIYYFPFWSPFLESFLFPAHSENWRWVIKWILEMFCSYIHHKHRILVDHLARSGLESLVLYWFLFCLEASFQKVALGTFCPAPWPWVYGVHQSCPSAFKHLDWATGGNHAEILGTVPLVCWWHMPPSFPAKSREIAELKLFLGHPEYLMDGEAVFQLTK